MVIARVCRLFSAICPNVSLFCASSLKVTFRLLRMVRSRIWALLSAICPKVSLFFASSFKVSFQNAKNDES